MNLLTPFTVLLERRRLLRAAVSLLTSVAMILPGVGLPIAQAQAQARPPAMERQGKLASDLDDRQDILHWPGERK